MRDLYCAFCRCLLNAVQIHYSESGTELVSICLQCWLERTEPSKFKEEKKDV